MLGLLVSQAPAQQPDNSSAPATDPMALCTTWRLAQQAIELTSQIKSVAVERVEQAQKLVEQCRATADCAREERVNLEQDLRDARYQRVRAEGLAASMEERGLNLRKQLESLRGADGVKNCAEGRP